MMRTSARIVALTCASAPLLTSSAAAQVFVPVFQDRIANVVTSLSDCGTENSIVRAEDFGPFLPELTAARNCDDGSAAAIVRQRSFLGDQVAWAELSTDGAYDLAVPAGVTLIGGTFFMYDFRVSEPTPYSIDGVVSAAPMSMFAAISSAVILRSADGTVLVNQRADPLPGGDPIETCFSQFGVLPAGEYLLFSSVNLGLCAGDASAETGNANARVRLALTACLGDLDGDGTVGLGDLTILLTRFGMNAGATLDDGDFDADGDVDLTDLSEMFARFGITCG